MKCDHLDHSGLLLLFITCVIFPLDQCDFNTIVAVGPEVKETLKCCWTIKCVALCSKNNCENTRVKICVTFYAFLLYKHMVLWIVHCTCWFGFVSGQGKGDKYEDKSINLFQYFTSSCYTGFGDDDKVGYTYSQSTNKNNWTNSIRIILTIMK